MTEHFDIVISSTLFSHASSGRFWIHPWRKCREARIELLTNWIQFPSSHTPTFPLRGLLCLLLARPSEN